MARPRDLSLAFSESHPRDAARVLEQLSIQEATSYLKLLPVRLSAPVIRHMLPTSAARCLEHFDDEFAAGVVHDLDAQSGTAILRYVPGMRRETLIAQLPTRTALAFRLLLTYPEDTVGAWINPHAVTVLPDTPASEAMERLRQSSDSAGTFIYVVDDEQRLQGVTLLADLVHAGRGVTLSQKMRPIRHRLSARASLAAAQDHAGWREYHALPVLERQERFIGALEHTTLYRILERRQHSISTVVTPTDSVSLLASSTWQVFAALLQSLVTLLPSARPLIEKPHEES